MNTIDFSPLFRSTIGYDGMARLLDSAFSSDVGQTTYPPYDIELIEENRYAITLAVAGFSEAELELMVEKGMLVVKGKKEDRPERKYLHHGIAHRSFERKFNLADFVEVTSAKLDHGLLTIELKKEVPEALKPRKIEIGTSTSSGVLEHKAQSAA